MSVRSVGARSMARGEFPTEPALVTHDRGQTTVGLFIPIGQLTEDDYERAGMTPKPGQEPPSPARTPAPPDQTVAPVQDGGGATRPVAPGMTQAERDRVLAKVNRKSKGKG